ASVEDGPEPAQGDPHEPDPIDAAGARRADHILLQPLDDRALEVVAHVDVHPDHVALRAGPAERLSEAVADIVLRDVPPAGEEDHETPAIPRRGGDRQGAQWDGRGLGPEAPGGEQAEQEENCPPDQDPVSSPSRPAASTSLPS